MMTVLVAGLVAGVIFFILKMRKGSAPVLSQTGVWPILEKYGDFLANLDKSSGRCVFSEALLPFPRSEISRALEQALSITSDKKARVLLENNRAMLASFVPPDQIPRDAAADIEFLEKQLKNDPGGQRILTSAKILAMDPNAFAARINSMPPDQRAEFFKKLGLPTE